MNTLKILSRSEMKNIKGGDMNPEFNGIECKNSSGKVTKSTCYPYGCSYAGDWCGDDTCHDITNC